MGKTMTTENEYKVAVQQLTEATGEVKKYAEKTDAEIKNLGKVTEETKAAADKALTEMNGFSARVTELEQKFSRMGSGPAQARERKCFGQFVVEPYGVKSLLK